MVLARFITLDRHSLGETLISIAITLFIIMTLQFILSQSISRIVRRVVRANKHQSRLEERKREDTLISIFRTANGAVVWIIGGIIILAEAHVNLPALLTGAGLVGIVAGFGAQNIIKDYLAGLFIIIENQYRVGDIITLNTLGTTGGVSGVVEDISIRITRLRDLDGNLHIVPNGLAGVITNRTFHYAQVNIDLPISYDADVNVVEQVINDVGSAMAKDPVWEKRIIEPIRFLRVDRFNDFSMTIKSLGKVQPGAQWEIMGEFLRRIKKAFEQNNIDVALPQMIVQQKPHEKLRAKSK